jgi:hypothetical protein
VILSLDDSRDLVETESGLIVPEYLLQRKKKPVAIDLFCGCGIVGNFVTFVARCALGAWVREKRVLL